MEKFTDKKGREWEVDITLAMVPELRPCGLDLAMFSKEEEANKLASSLLDALTDPERLGKVLWTICGEQSDSRGLDEKAFARGMNADALCAATDAVIFAAFDLVFKRPEFRQMIRRELPKLWAKVTSGSDRPAQQVPACMETGCSHKGLRRDRRIRDGRAAWSDRFTDDTGDVWQIVIDDAAEASIVEFLGIDLRQLVKSLAPAVLDISKVERIPRIGTLIFLTCARESPLLIEEFSRRLRVPETFAAAWNALGFALVNRFPGSPLAQLFVDCSGRTVSERLSSRH